MVDNFDKITITLDLEWSPDIVLKDVFDLLNQYDIQATVFSTHDDPFTVDHERGIHPNFEKSSSDDDIIHNLCSIYPSSIGVRSHKMHINTPLRNKFVNHGIEYESNYMAYKVDSITPYSMPEGTVQFPVYWMDDIWFRHDGEEPTISELIGVSGLKVFDFHPPHICFNTPSSNYYSKHKDSYWSEGVDISKHRYEGYGVRDLFIRLLEYVNEHGIKTYTLGELYREYK